MRSLDGMASQTILALDAEVMKARTYIEACIDFSDEEVSWIGMTAMRQAFERIAQQLSTTLHAFEQKTNEQVHIALTKGNWNMEDIIPVRIQSAGIANDVFHALTTNEASNFRRALSTISKRGNGAIIYMNQERSSNKILNRIRQFKKDGSLNSLGSMKDAKDFGIGAQIIHQFGIKKIDLITNNPIKRVGVGVMSRNS